MEEHNINFEELYKLYLNSFSVKYDIGVDTYKLWFPSTSSLITNTEEQPTKTELIGELERLIELANENGLNNASSFLREVINNS